MENKVIDLQEFNMTDEELFSHVDNNELDSEKITAPRYSYWKSVFRVFFKNRINIVFIALFAYIYPLAIGYDPKTTPFINIMDTSAQHLSPSQAIDKFGFSIHWILGSGDSGQSTFDYIWYGSSISISLAIV